MMRTIFKEALTVLRRRYPVGCRVELVSMNDPYNTRLPRHRPLCR